MIEDFAASRGAEVPSRLTDVESGPKADRPELAKALHLITCATLVIARLERLLGGYLLSEPAGPWVRSVALHMLEAIDLTIGFMTLVVRAL